jgi:methionyl aminopeptidase
VKLQVGMVLAIEPMIVRGDYESYVLPNRWTVVTRDGSTAAHYENTVAITKDGPVILTQDDKGPWCNMEGGVL